MLLTSPLESPDRELPGDIGIMPNRIGIDCTHQRVQPTSMPARTRMGPVFASGDRYEPRSTCPNVREIRFPSQTPTLKSAGLQRAPSLNAARSDPTLTQPTPVYTAAETTEAGTSRGQLVNSRNLASGSRGLEY